MIFLDLHKAYYALDRESFLDILKRYGVGPWSLLLIKRYWERLTMVACAVGYCVNYFKGNQGVTQGDPLLSTLLNVVVDVVVWNWIFIMEEEEIGMEGCVREIQRRASLFYAYAGLITSTQPKYLQGVFDALTGLFDWMGLRKNTGKTVGMVCQP